MIIAQLSSGTTKVNYISEDGMLLNLAKEKRLAGAMIIPLENSFIMAISSSFLVRKRITPYPYRLFATKLPL